MKEMFLRFGLWSMVMLLMVSSALSVSASASSNVGTAEYQGWLPELTDSRELNTTAIVSGKVFESGGKNPASGAAVHLEAWPNAEELGKMEEGDTFERLPIGKTVADKDGNYTLRIDKSVDTSQLLSVDGTMDVDLVAWTESGYVTYSFSVVTKEEKGESDSLLAQVDLNTGEIIKAMDVNLEINNPSAAKISGEPVQTDVDTGSISDSMTGVENSTTPTAFPNGCPTSGTKLVKNLGNRLVNVGSIHTATSGKEMKYTYSGTATSTLGVGVSATGKYGSFSSNGTVSRKRGNTTTWPWYKTATSRHLDTYFSYGKYCTTMRSPGPSFYWAVRPIRHEGGTNHRSASIPSTPSGYCVAYRSAGSGGKKSSTNAVTWSNGAKLSGVIGIDLSSRTGYATSAKLDYKFKTPGRLCGTHDKPNGSPRRLVMRSL